jgi:hypothetical protein
VDSKFKVFRLTDISDIESKLNEFDLGPIMDVSISMPDYRVIVLVVRYVLPTTPEVDEAQREDKAKNDKPAK